MREYVKRMVIMRLRLSSSNFITISAESKSSALFMIFKLVTSSTLKSQL